MCKVKQVTVRHSVEIAPMYQNVELEGKNYVKSTQKIVEQPFINMHGSQYHQTQTVNSPVSSCHGKICFCFSKGKLSNFLPLKTIMQMMFVSTKTFQFLQQVKGP